MTPGIGPADLLAALGRAEAKGHDMKGNALFQLTISGVPLLVVIDEDEEVVVTIWVEE